MGRKKRCGSSSSSSSSESENSDDHEELEQQAPDQQPFGGQAPPPGRAYPGQMPYHEGHTAQGVPPPVPAGGYPAPGYGSAVQQYGQAGYPAPGQPIYPAHSQQGYYQGQPGYPHQGQPGYLPQGQPGYPSQGQPGYPYQGQPGYPSQGQPGYPSQGQPGYPSQGQPGYTSQGQPGYPSQGQPGYPPQGQPAYPPPGPVTGGYPQGAGMQVGSARREGAYGTQGVQGIEGQLGRVQLDDCAGLFCPTVRPAAGFSAERDGQALRQAMKGGGTDERTIINIIGQRSNLQRQEIAKFYKTMFGRDMMEDLQSELSGNFLEAIMALLKPPAVYDAWSLRKAMEGLGTKESVLIEILCTRSSQQIREIVASYREQFKRELEKDIGSETRGHFKKLLVACCQGNRQELSPQQLQQVRTHGPAAVVDVNLAREDAKKLLKAGVKRLGTDESTFITVLTLRNMYQLQATIQEYRKIADQDLIKDISSETSGDFETGLKVIVRAAKNRPQFFADQLHDSMKGFGTDDSRLIRIIVSRSEIDLQDIKEMYHGKYQKTLESTVASDTSGDYKRLLLAIVGR